MAILESNTDLDVKGRVLATTVPNSTGSIVTWNASTKVFGLRTNAQVIADLGLQSKLTAGSHINITSNSISAILTDGVWLEDSAGNRRIHVGSVSSTNDFLFRSRHTGFVEFKWQDSAGTSFMEINGTTLRVQGLGGTGSSIIQADSSGSIFRSGIDPSNIALQGGTYPNMNVGLATIATNAVKLQTARTINGTSFDGTANIITSRWGTARNITIGNTTKSVNGSANVSWSLAEIGASSLIDNIEIGGRNFYKESATIKTYPKGSDNGNISSWSNMVENEIEFTRITPVNSGNFYFYPIFNTIPFSIKTGEKYVLSFKYRTTQTSSTGFYNYLFAGGVSAQIPPSLEWRTFSRTYIVTANTTTSSQLFGFSSLVAGTNFDVRDLKLEKGTIPTDWTPAIEDQVSDWNVTDSTKHSFIKNKPTIPTSSDYITTNTNQTGLSGNKATSGVFEMHGSDGIRLTLGRTSTINTSIRFNDLNKEGFNIGLANKEIFAIGSDGNLNNTASRWFWVDNTGLVSAQAGFSKTGATNNDMLLGSGGHRPVSDFALASSIPTVNNGQLTLSTGTGLSGSATFTANQAGSSTFSVAVASTHKLPTTAEWTAALANTVTRLRGTASGTFTSGDLTLLAGANTTITQSGANITIASTNTNTTYTAGNGLSLSGTTFGQAITTSGTGTFVTGITQTTNGFQINLGTPPNTNTTYTGSNGINVTGTVISPTYGTSAGTIAQGNDSRINNGQTAFDWGDHRQYGFGGIQQYLGGNYVAGGLEKPDYFGGGKLKLQMLRGTNIGATVNGVANGGWFDVLWLSSYTGGDVPGSNALFFCKGSRAIGFARQDFDSTTWGTYTEIIHESNLDFHATNLGYVKSSSLSGYLPLAGGTMTGIINLYRQNNADTGLSWYSPTYKAWRTYMSNPGTGPVGISAPAGQLVTSWALRSYIEGSTGYGWTFEKGIAQDTNPVVVAEIRSSDGHARFGAVSVYGGTASGFLKANGTIDTNTYALASVLSGYVPTSRTITAGNGLSGGGDLTANRTITLGTPSAITLSSTNSVTTSSHTHAFTPGGTTAQYIRGDGSLATMPTIPTVGNGSLTIGTPTGLSSSGTFTANQSGNSTISLAYATGYQGYTTTEATKLAGLSNYVLPTASATVLGGIKVGSNLSINASGVLSATNTNTTYTAGAGLTLSGTAFSLPVTVSGTGTYVQSVTQTTNGITVTLGTPPNTNTTYSNMAIAELNTGTVATGRIISASVLNQWLNAKGFSTQTLTAGTNITISGSTISATNTNTTYSAGTGLSLTGTTFANTAPNATHTGDVTGSTALTIANNAVTHAKYQNIATQRILGRGAAGTGVVQELTIGANLSLSTTGILSATDTITTVGANNTGFTSGQINFLGIGGIGIGKSGNNITISYSGGSAGIETIRTDNSAFSGPAYYADLFFNFHEYWGFPAAFAEEYQPGNATAKATDGQLDFFASYDSVQTIVSYDNKVDVSLNGYHITNILLMSGSGSDQVFLEDGVYAGDQVNITTSPNSQIVIYANNLLTTTGNEVWTFANLIWDCDKTAWVMTGYGTP